MPLRTPFRTKTLISSVAKSVGCWCLTAVSLSRNYPQPKWGNLSNDIAPSHGQLTSNYQAMQAFKVLSSHMLIGDNSEGTPQLMSSLWNGIKPLFLLHHGSTVPSVWSCFTHFLTGLFLRMLPNKFPACKPVSQSVSKGLDPRQNLSSSHQ